MPNLTEQSGKVFGILGTAEVKKKETKHSSYLLENEKDFMEA